MTRNAKGLQAKAKKCRVGQNADGTYSVTSPSGSTYLVDAERGRCNCRWAQFNPGRACAHIVAAKMAWDREYLGRRDSVWSNDQDAKRQHRHTWRMMDLHATGRAA